MHRTPRRYELLKQVGLDFDVIPSGIEEDYIKGESPRKHVLRLAEAKALDVGNQDLDRWVVAADTIVYVDHAILGKPKSREEAKKMLRRLSGKEHRVLTGISIHEAGMASVSDLLRAAETVLAAESQATTARVDVLIQAAQLERALGR